jgi:hypothetical protein
MDLKELVKTAIFETCTHWLISDDADLKKVSKKLTKEFETIINAEIERRQTVCTKNNGLHKHVVSNNEAGFMLNALYEKEVADKPKHYIPPISEVPFCPNCESGNTHENLIKHQYRCYDCGFAWAK